MGGVWAVPVRVMWLLVFAKVCCGNACHPVIAISVVPKLGTTHAVWMPGLDVSRCGPGVGRSDMVEIYVTKYQPSHSRINSGASVRWKSGDGISADIVGWVIVLFCRITDESTTGGGMASNRSENGTNIKRLNGWLI